MSSNFIKNIPKSDKFLPDCCLICKKKEKRIKDIHSGLYKTEELSECEKIEGGNLLLAAKLKNDEAMLKDIGYEGADLVSLEAKYHQSCHKLYTVIVSRTKQKSERPMQTEVVTGSRYENGYIHFCQSIIESSIIKNREIKRLTDLNELFKKCVQEKQQIYPSQYQSSSLKLRLQKSYPNLTFLKITRNTSELVFVNDLSATEVILQKSLDTMGISSSSTDTDSDTEVKRPSVPSTSQSEKEDLHMQAVNRELFHNAHYISERIEHLSNTTPKLPWPPTASDLTVKSAEDHVPAELFNFIAMATGCSNEIPNGRSRLSVDDNISRKILSTCQDIVNLAVKNKGRKSRILPKHIALAMSVRNITGSAKLISLLNGLGHCISNTQVLEHDTALAELQLNRGENFVPTIIKPKNHATVVWDNNDFNEETLSGKGTTHNTNGIIIQRQSNYAVGAIDEISIECEEIVRPKKRQRTLEPPPLNISVYHGGKRVGPKPFGAEVNLSVEHYVAHQKMGKRTDAAYFLAKLPGIDKYFLPGWTGFNIKLEENIPPITNIAYLPVIDASPTELATIKTILDRSISIADKLELSQIVVVFDQAIYAKVQEIRWKDEVFMDRIVVRMGEFHTCMAFLACIGKRFGDAGLQDIIIESEIVASGSITGVLNGHHYNRSLRTHKLVCEALQRIRWIYFLDTLPEAEKNAAYHMAVNMQEKFQNKKLQTMINSTEFNQLMNKYKSFIDKCNETMKTFKFWSSYIAMVENLLLFIRATREGNWHLHLASIRSLLPWFFAYDRPNYSRYLSVYWVEMCNLVNSHPNIDREFKNGNFVAQRHNHHGFAQTAGDQVIEQSMNLDSKLKGGIIGVTQNKGAVHRWTLSQHERASITNACHQMSGNNTSSGKHSELRNSRMKQDEKDIENIINTVHNMVNPFQNELEDDKLYHLASGRVASSLIVEDFEKAEKKGDDDFIDFCQDRLQASVVEFHDPITRNNLKTFKDTAKKIRTKIQGKEMSLKADRSFFARLLLVGNVRLIQIEMMLVYALSIIPAALSYYDGSMMKTNKAKFMESLEKDVSPEPILDIPSGSSWIWDSMALVQTMKRQETFGQFSNAVLQVLLKSARGTRSNIVHFVPDRYREKSIKDAERDRRGAEESNVVKIYSPTQKTSQQWSKYLSCGKNKENLLNFLYESWCKVDINVLGKISLVVGHNDECHIIRVNDSNTAIEISPIYELYCNHEEADTRLLLHSAYAAKSSEHVVINSPDTDVFVLSLAFCMDIDAELYFHTGKGNKKRTVAVRQVYRHYGENVCNAIIGCYCITGCDTISAFHGIGKKTALKVMKSSQEHIASLARLGNEFPVPNSLLEEMEAYTCELYGQKGLRNVNDARVRLF